MEYAGIRTFLKAVIVLTFFFLFMKGFKLYKNIDEHAVLARDKRQADNTTPPVPPWDPSLILGVASDLRPVELNETHLREITTSPNNTDVTRISDNSSLPRQRESNSVRGSVSSETLLSQLLRSIGIDIAIKPRQHRPVERSTQSPGTSTMPRRPFGSKILDFDPLARLLDQGKSSKQSSVNGTEKSVNRTIIRHSSANESTSGNVTHISNSSVSELHMSKNRTSQVLVIDISGHMKTIDSLGSMSDIVRTTSTTTSGRETWTTVYLNSTQDANVQTSSTVHAQSRDESTSSSKLPSTSVPYTTTDQPLGQNTQTFNLEFIVSSTSTFYINKDSLSSFAADNSTSHITNESQGHASSTHSTDLLNEHILTASTLNSIFQSTTETTSKNLEEVLRHTENSPIEISQPVKPFITKFKGAPSELSGINFAHFKLPMLEILRGTNNMVKGGLNRSHVNGPTK